MKTAAALGLVLGASFLVACISSRPPPSPPQPPEISVEGGGVSISDGSASISPSDLTDFGSVPMASTPVQHTFSVTNLGTGALITSGPTVPNGFTVVEGLVPSIPPGRSDAFTVELGVDADGVFGGDIAIANNDSDEAPFNFRIGGTVTPLLPEISVEGGGVDVVDGDVTPSASDLTDWGTVEYNSSPVRHSFMVINRGTGVLSIAGLSVPSGFSVVQGLPNSIAPGGSATFVVQLYTGSSANYFGDVIIRNNDGDENPFNFSIHGYVRGLSPPPPSPPPPEIVVEGDGQIIGNGQPSYGPGFGVVAFGSDAVRRSFTVRNAGDGALVTSGLSVPSGFSVVESLSLLIRPGDSDTFVVQLNTNAVGSFRGDVRFENNDPDEDPFSFEVNGAVYCPVTLPPIC